ncbi:hypothetical protein HZC32_00015 [Candidatus Woesearchaeota archaeon]|nr:hypothetical protein [Candidatus Woesearchaeota archaeon]
MEYTDKCILAKDEFNAKFFELNKNINPTDIGVEEGVCGNVVDGEIKEIGVILGTNVIPGPNWHKCDKGCKDGACRK